MITEDERFIEIQGILTMSDVHPADCIKINDLIIGLSKENTQLKEIEKEHQKINGELREENADLREKIILLQASKPMLELTKYYGERDKYKEVIEEVREWLKYKAETLDEFDIPKRKETGAFWFSTRGEIDNLLQILDKGVKDE